MKAQQSDRIGRRDAANLLVTRATNARRPGLQQAGWFIRLNQPEKPHALGRRGKNEMTR